MQKHIQRQKQTEDERIIKQRPKHRQTKSEEDGRPENDRERDRGRHIE